MREGKDNLFTWQQAVERLALGWMLPEGGNGMWQGVSAWHSNVNQFGRVQPVLPNLSVLWPIWRRNGKSLPSLTEGARVRAVDAAI